MIAVGVADDLTGANDCGGSFAARGLEAYVSIGEFGLPLKSPDAYLVSAETRFLGPQAARRRCQEAWGFLNGLKRQISYQKLDSTLRGNPGDEVMGMLGETGAKRVAFCNAYPHHGRTVLRGMAYVRGQRLDQSEYARDPLSPCRTARLKDLFPQGVAATITLGNISSVRQVLRGLREKVLCFDAVQTRDLDIIAKACLAEGIRHFAGASGFSGALAKVFGSEPQGRPSRLPSQKAVLAGSVSQTTLGQLERLERSHQASWFSLDDEAEPSDSIFKRFALSSVRRRGDLNVVGHGKQQQDFASRRMRRLVRLGLKMARGPKGRLWLLTGGHCAETFYSVLSLKGARIRREVMPGLPLLEAEGPDGLKVLATSKPGGFGKASLFVDFMKLSEEL